MEIIAQQKEKVDMILEPLQVMIQLAVISHCPVGTKVSICDNLLVVQKPTWSQGILRWYKNDNKDDLYYLFHAIRRYYIWYKSENTKIYSYILEKAIGGLDKLIETYKKSERHSILHTLSLYKNVLELDNTSLFKSEDEKAITMDSVFSNITDLYNEKVLRVVYNTLSLLDDENNDENKQFYVDSLQIFLTPMNNKLRSWIQTNLVV